nr:ABC transporter ATP-binding protein [Terribacillus saccharophilus]
MSETIVQVSSIKKHYRQKKRKTVKSVDNISFSIQKGETFGLVGESGSGKTTLGRLIVGIHEPTEGSIAYNGKDISRLTKTERRTVNREMQMIFQDPEASLNPRMKVEDIIAEGIDANRIAKGAERKQLVHQLLERVGLTAEHASRYPYEFSGGQRQRIGIARALAVNPAFIVADEPISALDVSIQAQIVNLLKDIQAEEELTFLFIAHDLAMVKHISDRIGVMYLGQLMELAPSEELFANPLHPYTQTLLAAIPSLDAYAKSEPESTFTEDPRGVEKPQLVHTEKGCPFYERCPMAMERCAHERPEWKEKAAGHFTACHLYD